MELYKAARGDLRKAVMDRCANERHIKLPGGAKCASCLQNALESVADFGQRNACTHQKLTYLKNGETIEYPLCKDCLAEVCLDSECHHSKTEVLAAMQPISWSAMLVQTEGSEEKEVYPKIVREETYVAREDGEDIMAKFWEWLIGLRKLIYETWQGEFPDVASCVLSEDEKKEHAEASRCYVCLGSFQDASTFGEEEPDMVDFLIGGEKVSKKARKCVKVLDHSHRTAAYRGEDHDHPLQIIITTIIIIIIIQCFSRRKLSELQYADGPPALFHQHRGSQYVKISTQTNTNFN